MNPRQRRRDRRAFGARSRVLAGLAMATLSCMIPAPARAGEGLDRISALFARKPEAKKESRDAAPSPVPSRVNWWSIPRPARDAAKELAASKKAAVTRCTATEQEGQVMYRFYASRRTGLIQKTEFLLTSVSEPQAVAQQRRDQQTLRYRLEHLGDSRKPKTSSTTRNPNGYVLPESP